MIKQPRVRDRGWQYPRPRSLTFLGHMWTLSHAPERKPKASTVTFVVRVSLCRLENAGAWRVQAAKRRIAALKKVAKKTPAVATTQLPSAALGEDDKEAQAELDDYFTSLNRKEAPENLRDVRHLSKGGKFRQPSHKLDSKSSDADLSAYFADLSKKVSVLDKKDKARLRKDSGSYSLVAVERTSQPE